MAASLVKAKGTARSGGGIRSIASMVRHNQCEIVIFLHEYPSLPFGHPAPIHKGALCDPLDNL